MTKKRFFCTFGDSKYFPYHDGWVEVIADSFNDAKRIFEDRYPSPKNGKSYFPRFAFIYSEQEFVKTDMWKYGNFGFRCHEVITEETDDKEKIEKAWCNISLLARTSSNFKDSDKADLNLLEKYINNIIFGKQ